MSIINDKLKQVDEGLQPTLDMISMSKEMLKTKRKIMKEPEINVISKEEFDERAIKVFKLLWETLSKSFGPYGAPTLIYNHPFSHVTKDGFTIMKNLSMNATETYLDQAIANMASDICGRLNYTVGDGTTSAVIATYSIYNSYIKSKEYFKNSAILPRDIINRYNYLKNEIINSLNEKITPIDASDRDKLKDTISKVVYVSSNGDELITDYISDFYKELGYPGISTTMSDDNTTKKRLVEGYKHDTSLMDRLYINSDNKTMELADTDFLIFTKRVTLSTYEYILKPLSKECNYRGRHLVCIAPTYDDSALQNKIRSELNEEFKATKSINLVLTNYRANQANDRKMIEDLAILLNTTPINSEIERNLIDDIKRGKSPIDIFNLDDRNINEIYVLGYTEKGAMKLLSNDEAALEELKSYGGSVVRNNEDGFRVGFSHRCSLGLKESLFSDFEYNEDLYNAALSDAKDDLREKEERYAKLGTFNLEVAKAQQRLQALSLKMGLIEIGGESDLSVKMLRDSVDDAIKASNSAFNNGIVLGCNVNLLQAIYDVRNKSIDENRPVDVKLLEILLWGFCDVYMTVLKNAFDNQEIESLDEIRTIFRSKTIFTNDKYNDNINDKDMELVISRIKDENGRFKLYDAIINYSIMTNQVFDVSSLLFTNSVVNSVETDRQILRATVDLISLLITGNQVVVTQKHNFED